MRAFPLILVAGALLVSSVFLMRSGGAADRPAAARDLEITFAVGQRGTFDLESKSHVTLPSGQVTTQDLTATLELSVLAVQDDAASVGFRLVDPTLLIDEQRDATRELALAAPVVATMRGGEFVALRFADGLTATARHQLDGLLRALHCAAPRHGAPISQIETDGLGRFRAHYERNADGSIDRRKAAYLEGADNAGVPCEVSIHAARATFTVAAEGPWLVRAVVHEHVDISSAGALAASVQQDITVTRRDPSGRSAAGVGAAVAVAEWLGETDAETLASARALERAMVEQITTRAATAADRTRVLELMHRYVQSGGSDMAALHALAKQLAETPELASDVAAGIRTPGLADRVGAGLCHALELGGAPACQAELATVGLDLQLARGVRFAAAVALGGLTKPTTEAESALLALWSGPEPSLASAAHLALGNLGKALLQHDPARYATLRTVLTDGIAHARDASQAVTALNAVRNTRDAALTPVAVARLGDADGAVRAAAATAAAALGGPSVSAELERALRDESDARVRAAMVRGLATSDGAAAASTCAELVPTESDERARAAMARVLADRVGEDPSLLPVLEQLLERETNDTIAAYVAGRVHRAKAAQR